MKKIIFILALSLVGCVDKPAIEQQKDQMIGSDFPFIVSEVSANADCKCDSKGLYTIKGKNANGKDVDFTTNIKFAIGDTITLCIDTTHAFANVLNMGSVVTDSTKTDSTKTN